MIPWRRAQRGASPRRFLREKSARKRSVMGCAASSRRSQRNRSISGDDSNAEEAVVAGDSIELDGEVGHAAQVPSGG